MICIIIRFKNAKKEKKPVSSLEHVDLKWNRSTYWWVQEQNYNYTGVSNVYLAYRLTEE